MMSSKPFTYETSQALQGQLSDGELAALRGLLRRVGGAIAALLSRLGALAKGRAA